MDTDPIEYRRGLCNPRRLRQEFLLEKDCTARDTIPQMMYISIIAHTTGTANEVATGIKNDNGGNPGLDIQETPLVSTPTPK